MKNKLAKFVLIILILSSSANFALAQDNIDTCPVESGKYKLLEGVPFVADACTEIKFPEYVSKVYIFAISAIGIASLLMMTIGAGYYLVSAGNASTAKTGKDLIKDALLGVLVAFLSYLLLYTLNPDILSGRLNTSALKVEKKQTSDNDDDSDEEYYDKTENVSKTEWCGTSVCSCSNGATLDETSEYCDSIKKYGGSWSCTKDSEKTECAQSI